MGWRARSALVACAVGIVLFAWAALAREFAPTSNVNLGRFDAIIVLGSRVDSDGNPTPELLARVTEGVREYERGVAPRLVLTGGPTHKGFVEARVMARAAEAQGIPASALWLDSQAMDTIHNACYSEEILQAHGWRSAEIVSSDYHLPRAAMIFEHLPLNWRTHAAPPLEPISGFESGAREFLETLKTVRYLTYAQWGERCDSSAAQSDTQSDR
ncbi:MAG TPA: YdcF family protein [Terracidiphilus sp.]|nr:YdcF family protein [Terracidiphilus sp.]